MGDWGYKVYENDEAADWFARFWESKNFDLIESTAANFDPKNENYDEIRAVAHVLACFGSPYACPHDFLDKLKPTIRKVVAILENMINPPDEAWDFLEIWENSPEIIAEVKRQIAELKAHLG
nr:DUF4259 domain-containing protein [uncultured Campylobacter sp.]